MAKKRSLFVNPGDILVMKNGRVCRVEHRGEGFVSVNWIDGNNEDSHIWDLDANDVESVFAPTVSDLFTFNVARSIHERLNRFKNL